MAPAALIETYIKAEDLKTCWSSLCLYLDQYGFDRILYLRKPRATRDNIHNQHDAIILSTYGAAIDDYYVKGRAYLNAPTVLWGLENSGAYSWRLTRRRFENDEMTEAEKTLHLKTQALGLKAGYTYVMPAGARGTQSGFGLCFKSGFDQHHVDDIWHTHSTEIVQGLKLFEIAIKRFAIYDASYALSDIEKSVLLLVAEGRTNVEIAELQSKHRRTIENILSEVRAKLGAHSTLQAVLLAVRQGQI